MTIREYKKGEHKSSFIGLRVVVKVGDDYRQKYYNFRKAMDALEIVEMRKDAETLNKQWNKERLIACPPKQAKVKIKKADPQKFHYGIYDDKGRFIKSFPFVRSVAKHFNVAESTISKALKNRLLVVNHKVIQKKKREPLAEKIEPFKTKNRMMVNGSLATAYRVYDLSGNIIEEKLFRMSELVELTKRDSTTIHEAVKKFYPVGVKYLISRYKGKASDEVTFFSLSPLSRFFKVFVFSRDGELLHWYVKPSIASTELGIKASIIYSCIKTGVSTHPDYFFTNVLPKTNYKHGIKTKFKDVKPVQIIRAHSKGETLSGSLSKVCKSLGISYSKVKKRLDSENGRSIVQGVFFEVI